LSASAGGHRVSVDFITCRGHGMCAYYLPSNIGLDEWGYPIVTIGTVAPDHLREAKRAALLCPELALKVERIEERAGAAHR
jgi:ferredoxin